MQGALSTDQLSTLIKLLSGKRLTSLTTEAASPALRQKKSRLREKLEELGLSFDDADFNNWWQEPHRFQPPETVPPIIMLVGPEKES